MVSFSFFSVDSEGCVFSLQPLSPSVLAHKYNLNASASYDLMNHIQNFCSNCHCTEGTARECQSIKLIIKNIHLTKAR